MNREHDTDLEESAAAQIRCILLSGQIDVTVRIHVVVSCAAHPSSKLADFLSFSPLLL